MGLGLVLVKTKCRNGGVLALLPAELVSLSEEVFETPCNGGKACQRIGYNSGYSAILLAIIQAESGGNNGRRYAKVLESAGLPHLNLIKYRGIHQTRLGAPILRSLPCQSSKRTR